MIKIHTRGWNGDHGIEEGEEPNCSLGVRVFIDDVEIPQVIRARVRYDAEFAITVITLFGAVEVINHTDETWFSLPSQ